MSLKRKRGANFTLEEKEKLLNLVRPYLSTILFRKTDISTHEAKALAWASITEKFNSSGQVCRCQRSLMKMWEKLKYDAKNHLKSKENSSNEMEAGLGMSKSDLIMEQMCELLNSTQSRVNSVDSDGVIPVANDSDKSNSSFGQLVMDEDEGKEITEQPEIQQFLRSDVIENVSEASPQPLVIDCPPFWPKRRKRQKHDKKIELKNSATESKGKNNKDQQNLKVEELTTKLLQEELQFKRKLYDLQLQIAEKDLEIKVAVLNQVLTTRNKDC